ncbi:hypothetical protein BD309DRAFT_1068378 [Dichomitus squalens]|nr:hypothetical protein BD309DRAFT_1068378 [Dichomitus squalens]
MRLLTLRPSALSRARRGSRCTGPGACATPRPPMVQNKTTEEAALGFRWSGTFRSPPDAAAPTTCSIADRSHLRAAGIG